MGEWVGVSMENDGEARIAGGPFRLQKYFIVSGFVVITAVTFLLAAFLYTRSLDTLLKSAENYARLIAENLNYNIYNGFYAPLKARGMPMDLNKWELFGSLDSLVKDFTYGLRVERIKIMDPQRKIVYSTEYDLIDQHEPKPSPFDRAIEGADVTVILEENGDSGTWNSRWLARTYYPLRELTGNFWMQGNIYGVIEITQDLSDQYQTVQRYVMVVILAAVGLMGFLFVTLTLIVRRGEKILLEQAQEQKRLEAKLQQSEKLASIGQLVATIAHEIRNPLGIIRSSAEMLAKKENPEPARIKGLTNVIVEEATRLSAILTDFLDFARPRSPDLKPLDIREVIHKVSEHLGQEIEAKEIFWSEDFSSNGVPLIMGDQDLLHQAFLNIAMNALAATEPGGSITVSVHSSPQSIQVEFADTGHGIDEEHQDRVFTPFFTTHEMGTGLGLSVVHNIVTAHAGEIALKSAKDEGTVFTILFPRAPVNSSRDTPTS